MKATRLLVAALLLFATSTIAAEKESAVISPGQYIRSGDSGTLKIRRGDAAKLIFEIESIGGNCHSCSVSGTISGKLGQADSWAANGSDSNCRITFERHGAELQISSATPEECRAYCGARADFEGNYKSAPALCIRSSQQNIRNKFLKLYRLRDYANAIKILEPLLSQCSEFVNWIEIDNIRNDLALAQFHSGNPEACLKTLAATRAASYASEENLKDEFPPCDFDNYVNVAKAAWYNKSLCEKANGAKKPSFPPRK
jgi:hypothetical protein